MDDWKSAAQAQQVLIQKQPKKATSNSYATLAQYLYLAGDTKGGDQAAAQAKSAKGRRIRQRSTSSSSSSSSSASSSRRRSSSSTSNNSRPKARPGGGATGGGATGGGATGGDPLGGLGTGGGLWLPAPFL